MNFLFLNENQMIESDVLNMQKCTDTMEYTFKLLKAGDYRMGGANNSHGIRVMFPKESDIDNMPIHSPGRWFSAMPAYLGGKYHMFGVKTYGANQNNSHKGLPRSILMMQLLDVETGMPLAYMSANILSAMRTGAVSGLAAKYLANTKSKKVAVIGPGVMAKYSLESVLLYYKEINEVSILGKNSNDIHSFSDYCYEKNIKKFEVCNSVHDVCSDADIIISASSQAEHFLDYPCIKNGDLKQGAAVIVVSAIRIEKALVNSPSSICIVDDISQYWENRGIDAKSEYDDGTDTFKNIIHNKVKNGSKVFSLYDFFGNNSFDKNDSSIKLFSSVGSPLEDVAWASECFDYAKKHNIGTVLKLWDYTKL